VALVMAMDVSSRSMRRGPLTAWRDRRALLSDPVRRRFFAQAICRWRWRSIEMVGAAINHKWCY